MTKARVKKIAAINIIVNVAATSISMCIPFVEGKLMDVLIYTKDKQQFVKLIELLLVQLAIQLVFNYILKKIDIVKTSQLAIESTREISNLIWRKNTESIMRYDSTYLHSRILQDEDNIMNYYFQTVPSAINNVVVIVWVAVALFNFNKAILLSLLIFVPIYVILYISFKEKISRSQKNLMESSNECFAERNSMYEGYVEIKTHQRAGKEQKRVQAFEEKLLNCIHKNFVIQFAFQSLQLGVRTFFQMGGFVVGGIAILRNLISLGNFTCLLQYFGMLLETIEKFLDIGVSYQGYKISRERMREIYDLAEQHDGETIVDNIKCLCLDGVNYKFSEAKNALYNEGLSILFEAGKVYTLVGENGIGKSTLLLVLLGIYGKDNRSGKIAYNDINIDNINMTELRKRNVSIMMQEPCFFTGTVRDYLQTFDVEGKASLMNKTVIWENAFYGELFNIDNYLDERVDCLSAGEKQIIDLFVCLAKKCDLYMLDEPTANVHSEMKQMIISLLKDVAKEGKIVIIVTHDKEMMSIGEVHNIQ